MIEYALQAFNLPDSTSHPMQEAIKEWFSLYYATDTPKEEDPSTRIAYIAVNKLCKAVFSEYSAHCNGMEKTLANLDRVKRKALQMALVGGLCYIKPIPMGECFEFTVVRRDCLLPLGRDMGGDYNDIITVEQSSYDGKHYTLVERRTQRNGLQIENRLYCSHDKSTLGNRVSLATRYPNLADNMTLAVSGVGMAALKTPMLNCVDGSDDGVAVYAAAVGLLHNIGRNEAQINNEFENGESRIIASADLMTVSPTGSKRLSDRQFLALDDDPETVGITIFSPQLREQSYFNRENKYLRSMEDQIGLKRGILSNAEVAEKTATEITSTAGEYNLTIMDFQAMWGEAMRQTVDLCGQLAKAYRIGEVYDSSKLSIDWGDGVLYDRDKANQEMLAQVQSGILLPERYLAWYYGLPCETEADMAAIRTRYMPQLETLAGE